MLQSVSSGRAAVPSFSCTSFSCGFRQRCRGVPASGGKRVLGFQMIDPERASGARRCGAPIGGDSDRRTLALPTEPVLEYLQSPADSSGTVIVPRVAKVFERGWLRRTRSSSFSVARSRLFEPRSSSLFGTPQVEQSRKVRHQRRRRRARTLRTLRLGLQSVTVIAGAGPRPCVLPIAPHNALCRRLRRFVEIHGEETRLGASGPGLLCPAR